MRYRSSGNKKNPGGRVRYSGRFCRRITPSAIYMRLTLFFIRLYRQATAWFRLIQVPGLVYTPCRFYPSCSEYAELAVCKHGAIKGLGKAIGRIFRCNPFASGGADYPA